MSDGAQWYVVHTYSGYENTVKATIEKYVENRGLQDLIHEISISTTVTTTACREPCRARFTESFIKHLPPYSPMRVSNG